MFAEPFGAAQQESLKIGVCQIMVKSKITLTTGKTRARPDARPVQLPRRGGRVVEGARLESVYRGNLIEGSNPSLSASALFLPVGPLPSRAVMAFRPFLA
jgi:hypothetical protein